MNTRQELAFYVSVATGMALASTVFTMIGGLFAIGSAAEIALAILAGGLLCTLVAGAVAELASMHPSAPGVRSYLKSAFGDGPSLFVTFCYLAFVVAVAGVEANVFAEVVSSVMPGIPPDLTIFLLCGSVIAINLRGMELPRAAQVYSTYACVGAILVASVHAAFLAPAGGGPISLTLVHPAAFPSMVGMAVFLFMGFEWVTPLGLSPRSYERAIPLSMFLSILLLAVAYGLFVIGASRHLPAEALRLSLIPQVLLFESLYGGWGGALALAMSFGAVFSTFNAGIMGGARLVFLLSREGRLPEWASRISEERGAPIGAVASLGGLTTLAAYAVRFTGTAVPVAIAGAVIISLVYATFLMAVPRLRKTRPKARRSFRTPVPLLIHYAAAALMVLLAVLTLLGDPTQTVGAGIGVAVALLTALAGTVAARGPAAVARAP